MKKIYLLMQRAGETKTVVCAFKNPYAAEDEARQMNKLYSPASQNYYTLAVDYDRGNPILKKVLLSVLVVTLMVCGLCSPVWFGW